MAPKGSFEMTILEDPVATACFNLDGTVRLWNPAAERLFGFTAAEALGHRPPTIPVAEFSSALVILKQIERGESIEALEIRRQRKDGSAIELLLYESPLRDEAGEITGSLSHYIDISDRQRIAAALRQSVDDLEQRGREMTLLAELGELLDSCQTLDEAHQVIGRMAESLFPGDAGALYELEPDRNTAEAVTVWGDPPPRQRVMAPTECWALRRGRMHVVRPDEEPFCPHIAEPISVGAICEPLAAQSETLGVLHLQVRKARGSPTVLVERERVTQTLGEHLALALANFRLRAIMREQSSRDPLTDLYNRRFMEETLYRELRRAAREDGSVGVLMIDLDRFKALNDAFGHATGDVALRTVADYLRAGIRGGDVACRYGGEEFVVILPKASLADAVQRGEALRDGLRLLGDPSGEGVPTITISVGVAAFPDHGSSSDEVLAAADRALYRAKAEGRNRVAVADDREAQENQSTGA